MDLSAQYCNVALHPKRSTVFFLAALVGVLSGCVFKRVASSAISAEEVITDTTSWFDSARMRSVPLAFYYKRTNTSTKRPLVIFGHGYNRNAPDSYLQYAYLNRQLAANGYFVVSIQHDLPTDSLMPSTGIARLVRLPFWENGVDNILFVINELKRIKTNLDAKELVLIGHSNGGDIISLFCKKYPELVSKIITLDNRRMPLPRTKKPRVYSLRSSDQPADEGVLPTPAERKKFSMTIINLSGIKHDEMDDHGTLEQQKQLAVTVLNCLKK